MNIQKQSLSIILSLALTGLLTNFTSVAKQSPVSAIFTTTSVSQFPLQLALKFNLPPKGAPGNRSGAANRGCGPTPKLLTALVPGTNQGLTVAEHPTFWFYVPYPPSPSKDMVFKLLDKQKNQEVYKIRFTVTGTPGIISVTLPDSVNPLAVGKRYQWIFTYLCNPKVVSQDIVVHGYVERVNVSPQMAVELNKAKTPLEKVAVMAENGIWFDALTELAQLRRKEPNNEVLLQKWEALLTADGVKLNEIIAEPLVSLSE